MGWEQEDEASSSIKRTCCAFSPEFLRTPLLGIPVNRGNLALALYAQAIFSLGECPKEK